MKLDNDILSSIPFKNTSLTLARLDDAEFINELRSNADLTEHLSKIENNVEMQRQWLSHYFDRENKGLEYYFVIRNNNDRVGTIRIYNIRNKDFSWGSWIVSPNAPMKTALESMLNIYYLAFEVLNFETAHIDVRNENKKVLSIHQKMGCRIVSVDGQDTFFELSLSDYHKCKEKFYRILK